MKLLQKQTLCYTFQLNHSDNYAKIEKALVFIEL